MNRLSRGQFFGVIAILLITMSFIGAALYGVMFGDTAAAKHYSAVSPSLRGPSSASGKTQPAAKSGGYSGNG